MTSKGKDVTSRGGRKGLSRRRFLAGFGVAAGAAVGAGALAVPHSRNKRLHAAFPVASGNNVDLPPNGRTVVIIGGGLSGLQAGVELSSRGFKVIVLEKSGTPGGKLKTWRDRRFGPDDDPHKNHPQFKGYVREHGLHAVWGFYNNLREFLGRHGWGLQRVGEGRSLYLFLDKDGTRSYIPTADWPPPADRLQFLLNTIRLNHVPERERGNFLRMLLRLSAFDYADEKQRHDLDGITFKEYAKRKGLSGAVIDKVFAGILEMAHFDTPDHATAFAVANLFSLIAGSTEDMKADVFLSPPGETFIAPMVKHILDRGGEIHFNTQVTGLDVEGARVKATLAARVPGTRVRRCAICGELIYGDADYHECPFCGAGGDQLRDLSDVEKAERRFTGDYFIAALDVPGAQNLIRLQENRLAGLPYFKNILDLHATAVYVVNLWYEGQEFWTKSVAYPDGMAAPAFFATGFDQLGITINMSFPATLPSGERFYGVTEYKDRGLSIIETQIAKTDTVVHLTNAEIADLCHGELKAVMPDIPAYRSSYVNRWNNYTAYHAGDERRRPPIQSPIENLLFIGDMVFVPHPAVFMEKTNVTAKWATNILLDKIGQQAGKIEILPSWTPSLLVSAMRRLSSVYS